MISSLIATVLGKPLRTVIRPYFVRIHMSLESLKNQLANLNDQLHKVSGEITGKIDELRTALENAGQLPAEVNELLTQIQATVDSLDAIVPDAETPTDPEDPEVPADPAPEQPE